MSGNVIRRRRFPRRRFPRPVGLLAGGKYTFCFGEEIGEGGMLVSGNFDLQVGKKVVLTFIVPGQNHAVLRGEVRYQKGDPNAFIKKVGIQFIGIKFEDRRMIREYIAKKTEEEAIQELPYR